MKARSLFLLGLIFSSFSYGQIIPGTGGTYGITAPPITSIGIGNFTTSPLAALHVNSTLLPPNTNFTAGDVFRTTGQANQLNSWRLYTNNQKFRVFVPANSNEANLEAVQAAGYLNLNTAGGTNTAYPNIKLRIFPDDTDRMVAFENPNLTSSATFVPAYNAKFIINDRNNAGTLCILTQN
jgi:hypothetical protein